MKSLLIKPYTMPVNNTNTSFKGSTAIPLHSLKTHLSTALMDIVNKASFHHIYNSKESEIITSTFKNPDKINLPHIDKVSLEIANSASDKKEKTFKLITTKETVNGPTESEILLGMGDKETIVKELEKDNFLYEIYKNLIDINKDLAEKYDN